ncbi:restriction endonuclease [Micromonospora sp. NPDC048830]|uniref:restriction endonuclease n=1 Tax=Micromonospora sp. NPDC048830 TaxID=3364257 RepID=UPI00371E213B
MVLDTMDALSAGAFEEWTAWLLERDGCKIIRRHDGPNDQGADVIAITACSRRVVLQCKHSTKLRNRVDPRYLHELNGTARPEHGADIVGIVTNRMLSDAAQRFAMKHQIHVIDRPALKGWATYGVSWLPSNGQTAVSLSTWPTYGVAAGRACDSFYPLIPEYCMGKAEHMSPLPNGSRERRRGPCPT